MLRVSRKGYTRKAYTRKDGTRVKATRISDSTFNIKDRGKRGRTPKADQWFDPQVHTGWEKTQKAAKRRGLVLKGHDGNMLASGRSMQALANISIDRRTKEVAAADARFFFGKLKKR